MYVLRKKKKEYGLSFTIIVIFLLRLRLDNTEKKFFWFSFSYSSSYILMDTNFFSCCFFNFLRERERSVQMCFYYWPKCFSQSINQSRRWVELLLAPDHSFSFTSNFFFPIIYLLSFSCSFLRSFNVSQLLTVNTIVYINTFLFLRIGKKRRKRKNWTHQQTDISTLVNYI